MALLIGVSEYEAGLNSLPGAVKDVEAMQRVLVYPGAVLPRKISQKVQFANSCDRSFV
ncbi:MAG: caspase family protein [Coleofasciculaceae cyanobacterium]